MNETLETWQIPGRAAAGALHCPACGAQIYPAAWKCPACDFTVNDARTMFPGPPPPLLPVLDAAELLSADALAAIDDERQAMRRRFPQFRWRVCTVRLEPGTSLPEFGFWLLNQCPLDASESAEDRAWTVLLLVDATSRQAAAVTGYAAEAFISDRDWTRILTAMAEPWHSGDTPTAIRTYFRAVRSQLERARKRIGVGRHHRTPA